MGIELSLGITFLAGVLSFLSPCVLPLIPSFFGFLGSKVNTTTPLGDSSNSNNLLRPYSRDPGEGETPRIQSSTMNRWILVFHTIGFVFGFVTLFALLGLVFSGSAMLLSRAQGTVQIVSGLIVILFAFHTWFNLFPFLQYEKKANLLGKTGNFFGSFLAGAAFGAGWTPCIGPILASILFFAAVSGEALIGMMYLAVYGLGLGLPFIIMSLFFQKNSRLLVALRSHQAKVKFLSGLLLLFMGVFIITGQTLVFASWLPTMGFQLERWILQNPGVSKNLGLLVFGLIFVLLLIIGLIHRPRRAFSRIVIVSLVTLMIAGILLQFLDRFNLILMLARWIQFQGI